MYNFSYIYTDESRNIKECEDYMSFAYWGQNIACITDVMSDGQPNNKFFFKVIRFIVLPDGSKPIIGVCRISIDKPEYIIGYDEDMTLTNEEIDELIEGLSSYDFAGWKHILDTTNWALECIEYKKEYSMDHPMPDYSLLKQ